jgi:hypothetical protein
VANTSFNQLMGYSSLAAEAASRRALCTVAILLLGLAAVALAAMRWQARPDRAEEVA